MVRNHLERTQRTQIHTSFTTLAYESTSHNDAATLTGTLMMQLSGRCLPSLKPWCHPLPQLCKAGQQRGGRGVGQHRPLPDTDSLSLGIPMLSLSVPINGKAFRNVAVHSFWWTLWRLHLSVTEQSSKHSVNTLGLLWYNFGVQWTRKLQWENVTEVPKGSLANHRECN